MKDYNKKLIPLAKYKRKTMTPWERKLWYEFLKDYPIRFQRQKTIGNYIVDFYSAIAHLVIELDGSQHWKNENKQNDHVRDKFLKSLGLTILRYSNHELNTNFEGVCKEILSYLTPHPSASQTPSPEGEG